MPRFEGNELLALIERLRGSFVHRSDNVAQQGSDMTLTIAGGVIGNYTEIGSWSNTYGAHAVRVTITGSINGFSMSKEYLIATKYAQTSAWVLVPPSKNTGYYNYDFHLVASQSAAVLSLRVVIFRNNSASTLTLNVHHEQLGPTSDTFTPASGTGSMTVPTAVLTSGTEVRAIGGGYMLTRTIPTTVGNYVEVATVNGVNGNGMLDLTMGNIDGGFVISKRYHIPMTYGLAPSWCIVQPIASTGPYSGQDCALVAIQSGTTLTLRILRTVGTTAGTMVVWVANSGDYNFYFDEVSGTGSMAVPTIFHPGAVLTQVGGKVGINVTGPASTLQVVGASDVIQAAIKANATQTVSLQEWQNSSGTALAKVTGTGKFQTITPTTSDASVNLPAGTAPSSPVAGDVWSDSTQKALTIREAGVNQNAVGTIFTATADKNINTTAAETTLFASGVGTLTLPANFWAIGKTVRITMQGYYSQTGASPTRTLKVKIGSVAVCNTALTVFGGAVTNKGFAVDVLVTCRTLGASGTVMGQGMVSLEGNASPYGTATTATATVDTTASGALDVTWTWGTSDANNKVVVTNATVEVLN